MELIKLCIRNIYFREKPMRKNYIDNLRFCTVLLLFPFHTFMMYNNWAENFYVRQEPLFLPSLFNQIVWPWFMPLLFLISGIGTYHALEKRSTVQFIKEIFLRLFIPLVSGILVIIPVQTFFAEKFHNSYEGSYISQYSLFFTKGSDLTGYTGGFTPGHLWFILYLFVISLLTLPLINILKNKQSIFIKPNLLYLTLIGLLPLLSKPILSIGGKSIVEYAVWYLLGFTVFSKDEIIDFLETKRKLIHALSAILFILFLVINVTGSFFSLALLRYLSSQFYAWFFILSIIVIFKKNLNNTNKVLTYLRDSSFPVYILHQSVLIFCAYYVVLIPTHSVIHIVLMIVSSIFITFTLYELLKRIPGLSLILLGIKRKEFK